MKHRIQYGSVIVEVQATDTAVLLTVSKERYDDDRVQVSLSARGATSLGHLLIGEAESIL